MPERTVQCYHCGLDLQVGAHAISMMCPHCYRGLRTDDIVIKRSTTHARVQTCGTIHITKRGRLYAGLIQSSRGVTVEGTLHGQVITRGPVVIGPRGKWTGGCTAPMLTVHEGARINAGLFRIQPRFEFGIDPAELQRGSALIGVA